MNDEELVGTLLEELDPIEPISSYEDIIKILIKHRNIGYNPTKIHITPQELYELAKTPEFKVKMVHKNNNPDYVGSIDGLDIVLVSVVDERLGRD